MRNLVQYPITKEELLYFVNKLSAEHSAEHEASPLLGDMRSIYYHEIVKIIEGAEYKFDVLRLNGQKS